MKELYNLILRIFKNKEFKYYLLNIADQISRHRSYRLSKT